MAKKTDVVLDELIDDAGTEPRVYELGFHLDPELPQEEVKKAYQAIREGVASVGTIIAEGEPVKIPLAYRISRMETTGRHDFTSAFFCWIAYETDTVGHEKIGTMAREDVRIFRFLDIRSSADEAKHSADMQEMFAQAATEREEEEIAEVIEPEAAPAPAAEAPVAEVAE